MRGEQQVEMMMAKGKAQMTPLPRKDGTEARGVSGEEDAPVVTQVREAAMESERAAVGTHVDKG